MGKKNLNPADAYRKSQRKKELKKNKTERSKTRDLALVKKDTTDLEDVIKELEDSRKDAPKLAELKAELEKINKRKAEYVAEHPEARRLVYRRRKQGEPEPELPTKKPRNLFDKKGLPRHPERSIYYDPVMNPYGVAPPGMPYIERPLLPGEIDSDADSEEEDYAPSPEELASDTEFVTSDDEIRMPDEPPPWVNLPVFGPPQGAIPPTVSVHPQNIPPYGSVPPPPPPGFSPWNANVQAHPSGFQTYHIPPPINLMNRQQNPSSIQDPLSSLPHQTFQAHRSGLLLRPSSSQSLPVKNTSIPTHPSLPPKPTTAAQMAAATIEGAPELRDLKKEATAFIPTAVKRKKVQQPNSDVVYTVPLPND